MDNSKRIVREVHHDDCKRREELLNEAKKNADDFAKVIAVGEVISDPKQTFSKCSNDDDDCVILDGDPDKPVAIEGDGRGDSDDLCLVGEKGRVACRDYPHPRHLCAKFPFDSTPHERHCEKCHCYVCDSVAPCAHWGDGVSNTDHCHATEKSAFWEVQRNGANTSYKAAPFVSEVGLTPVNQVLSLPSNNPLVQSQLRSIISNSTSYGAQESGCHPSKKNQPYLIHYPLQRHSIGHSSTQLFPRCVAFKRLGTSGGISPIVRNNYGYQFSVIESLGSRWQDLRERGNPMSLKPQAATLPKIYQNVEPITQLLVNSHGNVNYRSEISINYYGGSFMSQNSQSHAVQFTQPVSQTFMGNHLGNLMCKVPVATLQRWGSHLNPMSLQPQAATLPLQCLPNLC